MVSGGTGRVSREARIDCLAGCGVAEDADFTVALQHHVVGEEYMHFQAGAWPVHANTARRRVGSAFIWGIGSFRALSEEGWPRFPPKCS